MLFNPFTGKPRRPEDIESDPRGVLIWDGEEPLKAAAPVPADEIDRLRVQCKMLMDDKAALQKTIDAAWAAVGNDQMTAYIKKFGEPVPLVAERDALRERVRVLEGALEGALKWGAALSPDEHAKCRAALKRED
jgi:hypothetical protein